MSPPSVYISSTYEDLKPYRDAVFRALEKAGFLVGRMEGYAASDERPLQTCLKDVESRDVYVGIFAWRYGYIPRKEHGNAVGLSITECEYRHALARSKPTLCFFHDEKAAAEWPDSFKDERTGEGERGARIRALRRELGTEKTGDFFRSPEQLAYQVLAAIIRHGTVRRPFMVPPLQADFVARPEITSAMVSSLLADDRERLAVHGSGGFGKTTLAIAVCHEPEVIKAFPDGTVWVALGDKDPQVERRLAEIYAAFTGSQPVETTVVGIGAEIRQKLFGKRCLIVVDDVWNNNGLKPFTDLGAHRLMFTTRKRELAPDPADVEVREMAAGESVQLLTRGMPEASGHQGALAAFIVELGGWPLLLELTNARLLAERRAQRPFDAALAYITKLFRQRGVIGFDRKDTRERNKSVANCLDTGLDAYKESMPTLRARAAELGLFPEDIPIPEQVLCEFWDCDELALNEDTLRYLDDLSIIRWDRQAQVVRLHDSVRAVLATWVPDKPASHRRLLDAWGDAKRLPHAYAWQWYGWHCLEGGREEEFRRQLVDFDWMQAKLLATDITALTADYYFATAGSTNDLRALRLIQGALQRSAHVVTKDPAQFASQMVGRLLPHQGARTIQEFLSRIVESAPKPWLRPLQPALHPTGTLLIHTLKGHSRPVTGVAISADGRRAVSVSQDGTLKVWDVDTGRAVRTLGHRSWPSEICFVAMSADGRRAISSDPSRLIVWDLETGVEQMLETRSFGVLAHGVAVSADGRCAVSASADGTLKVWDLETGRAARKLGHSSLSCDPCVVAMSADGRWAVSTSSDQHLTVWDLETGQELRNLEGHSAPISGVGLSADGRRAISASKDGTLKVWDLETGRELRTLGQGSLRSHCVVAMSADGRHAVSTFDLTLKAWDVETGRELLSREAKLGSLLGLTGPEPQSLEGHSAPVYGLAVSADGRRAVTASQDATLKVWDVSTGVEPTLEGHLNEVLCVAVSANGRRAVSASEDGALKVWDVETGQVLLSTSAYHLDYHHKIVGLAVSADGQRAVSAFDGMLKVWDVDSGRELRTLEISYFYCDGELFRGSGRSVSASFGKTVRVLDLGFWGLMTKWVLLRTLEGHSEPVSGVAVSADGQRAVSASTDGTLKVWDLGFWGYMTGRILLRTLKGHSAPVSGVAVSANAQRAVSVSTDGMLKVWDVEMGRAVRTLGHRSLFPCTFIVAISADGRHVVSVSRDQTLTVWDLEAGRELRTLVGHSDDVNNVALSPDGRRVVSASNDKTLKVWDLYTGALVATFTCDATARSCAFITDTKLIAGDAGGRVHILSLEV
jgi:WD40 repeat protein